MLVVDIDGTLLDPTARITDRTKAAIRAAVATGCIVTLATGRRFATARPIAGELGLELPIILHNGALIKDSVTGDILYHHPLPPGAAAAAVNACVRHGIQPILYENAYTGDGMLTGPEEYDGPFAGPYLARAGGLLQRLPYERIVPVEPPLQVAAYDHEEPIRLVERLLVIDGCRTVTSMTTTGGFFLELISDAVSKATGIARFAAGLGIRMDEVIAVGDNHNDLEMLQEVGMGVAMGNAPEAVRLVARTVTRTNAEDGVAEVVERYLLGSAREPGHGPGSH